MERLDGTLFARVQLRQVVAPVLRAAASTAKPAAFDEAHDCFQRRLEQFRLQGLMVASLSRRGNMPLALVRDGIVLGAGCGAHVGLTLTRGAAGTLEALLRVPPLATRRLLQSVSPLVEGVLHAGLCLLCVPLGASPANAHRSLGEAAARAGRGALYWGDYAIRGAELLRQAARFGLAVLACSLGAVLGAGAGAFTRAGLLAGIGLAGPVRCASGVLGRLPLSRLVQPAVPLLRWLPDRIDALGHLTAMNDCVRTMPHNLAHALERTRIERAYWSSNLELASVASARLEEFVRQDRALRREDAPSPRRAERLRSALSDDLDGELRKHRRRLRDTMVEYRRDCRRAFDLDPGQLLSNEQALALRLQVRSGGAERQAPAEAAEAHPLSIDDDDLWCMRQEWLLLRNPGLATERPDAEETRTVFAVRANAFERLHDARRGLCKMMPLPRATDVGTQSEQRHQRLRIGRKIENEIINWLDAGGLDDANDRSHLALRNSLDHQLAQQGLCQAPFYHLVDDLFR